MSQNQLERTRGRSRIAVRALALALAFAAATAVAVVIAGPSDDTRAAGENLTEFDAQINGGAPVPSPGTPVSAQMLLNLGTVFTELAPTSVELPDYLEFRLGGVTIQKAPGLPGGMPLAGIGARAGEVNVRVSTAKILALVTYGYLATSVPYAGLVPECGDNRYGVRTRDYLFPHGASIEDDQIATNYRLSMFVGDMRRESDDVNGAGMVKNRADALYADEANPWTALQYADESNTEPSGTLFIQSYDDDNNNGYPDWSTTDAGDAASKAEPSLGTGLADPFAVGGGKTFYWPGQPQTQHDYDRDGIPNGVEYMPDFLPALVDRMGLTDSWVFRGYGATIGMIHIPLDVHLLGFHDGTSAAPTRFILIMGNPYARANANLQVESICGPMMLNVSTNASTVAPDYGRGVVPSVQTGDTVQVVTSGGAPSVEAIFSDGDDPDLDGIAGPEDLCDSDGPANDDPDNDLVSAGCDVDGNGAKTSIDWDGDGFQNNTDNCPMWPNPEQWDRDDDSVGDVPVCDPLLVLVDGEWNGKGDGTATSLLLDNDLRCTDTYTTTEALGDMITGCTDVDDANDDGEADASDCDSNEDGDLLADCDDPAPLDPLNASDGDFDNDGCTDTQELGPEPSLGGGKMPFNWWDNYDVTLDGSVDLSDTLDILAYFGSGPDDPGAQERDRAQPAPELPAILVEGDDGVDLTDALNSLAQFGFSCAGIPGTVPPNGWYIGG